MKSHLPLTGLVFLSLVLLVLAPVPIAAGGNLRFPKNDLSCVGDWGDPKLADLADNGGPTHTMALLPGSAAIGRGKIGKCNASPINGMDQRGLPRAAPCDSGAYEVQ